MSSTESEPPSAAGKKALEGNVALVTGASRGIGSAIAIQLARSGAALACVATSAENCTDVVAACRAEGGRAEAFGVDVSDTDGVAALVKGVVSEFGQLDILVNNAGITRDQILLRMSEEDFDRVVSVNLKGAWNFSKAAARSLMKTGGCLINVGSIVGLTGNAGQSNYAASKAGLIGLSRSLAKELASRNVRVNTIAPGFIGTDMTSAMDEVASRAFREQIPLGRIGETLDVALAVDFLAGPGGRYITGQVLVVDGGLSI